VGLPAAFDFSNKSEADIHMGKTQSTQRSTSVSAQSPPNVVKVRTKSSNRASILERPVSVNVPSYETKGSAVSVSQDLTNNNSLEYRKGNTANNSNQVGKMHVSLVCKTN
jgi:hypothetical protein